MPQPVQTFQVAIKAVVVRDRAVLAVREREGHAWELPGGRIDVGEELVPHRTVLQRELREELGAQFRCRIGEPVLTSVRTPRRAGGPFVFLVAVRCEEPSGLIELSDEHDAWQYVDAASWRALAWAPGYVDALAEFFARA